MLTVELGDHLGKCWLAILPQKLGCLFQGNRLGQINLNIRNPIHFKRDNKDSISINFTSGKILTGDFAPES